MASDQEAPKQPVTMQDLQDMWDSADSADQPQDAPQQAQDNTLPDQPEELDQEVEEVQRDPNVPSREDWKHRHYQATQHIKTVEQENAQLRNAQQTHAAELSQLQERLAKLEKGNDPDEVKRQEAETSAAKEMEEFINDFPTINNVVESKITQAVSQLEERLRSDFGVLLQERNQNMRVGAAQRRHQLANEKLGITNAREIDSSQHWADWVSASPQRLQIASAGVMDSVPVYPAAAEDFVVLMREYLQQNPQVGQTANAPPATQPKNSASQRIPNTAVRQRRQQPRLDQNSSMEQLQRYWDSTPEPSRQENTGAW